MVALGPDYPRPIPKPTVATCPQCGGPAPFVRGWGRRWCSKCHLAALSPFVVELHGPSGRRAKRQHTGRNPGHAR